jgi:fused signal recognition particle receptor
MFKGLMQKVDRMMGRGVIDEQLYEELEEALLQADTHVQVAGEILDELRQAVRTEKITDAEGIKRRLQQAIAERFDQPVKSILYRHIAPPTVYLFVGVNGVGKTTTIGKLATRLTSQGRKVMLAAGDTFRAAAIDQLKIWADRSGSEFVGAQPGSDPGAVIFDAIQAAKSRGCDFVLADTAGRQHSKAMLMNELGKITKVLESTAAANVTGLVLTKLDGTARGGALIGIWDRFQIPIKLVGVGERPDQLQDFDPAAFAEQMFED